MATYQYADSAIVDENDQPIGQMQLFDAINAGHCLRVARVMVENSDGNILLQQRGPNVMSPLLWNDAASGHVDAGESYISTAARELAEETGITVADDDLEQVDYLYIEEGNAKRFHTVYRCIRDGEPSIQDDEVAAFRWISKTDLAQELTKNPETFTAGFRTIANRYLKNTADC